MFPRLALAASALLGLAFTQPTLAADPFPVRPVRIVVGFGPGGLGDTVTRALAQKMAESMGQSVVVENAPGAGGITAAQAVARAAPDGYTLGLSSGQNAFSPFLFKSLPYDPVESFSMISTLGSFAFVLVADKESPLKTVVDVLAAGRRDPQHFNIGTISAGSAQNLSAQLFVSMSKLTVPVVPFKTTGDVIGALRGKQIEAAFETSTGVLGQIKGGGLKAIAVTSPKRVSYLPEVPTVAESGVAELATYASDSWNGIVAPAGVPRDIVVKLNQEIAKALKEPAMQANLRNLGIEPRIGSPEDLKALYRADQAKWGPVIERAGIPKQ
ncbi:MAG TPA: tripartite tricarboxylate transporter substrate-binding protein [Burkholderiales bacterium]|jgi:tripartite-type tricarboxylate transporter receptor subunit TctC|nr:tripartite tricarboxylate transporter substrate-binding protein [Burkholderiales bacterium]